MLFNTHYLNTDALANYIAALEGGLRESGSSRAKGSHGLGGSLGISAAKLEARKESETESTVTLTDHNASRLHRLIMAGHDEPEAVGWIQIAQPDIEFRDAGTGAFVEWECDVYIPETIAAMSSHDGLSSAIKTMKTLLPSAHALGLDTQDVPNSDEMDAMATFLEQLDVAPVVVGEDSETDWKVVGSLDKRWIASTASFDDRVQIIGKVTKRVDAGRWYPMVSLPGMNLVSREERRRLERQGPADPSQEPQFMQGPLLVVDYLAIYS